MGEFEDLGLGLGGRLGISASGPIGLGESFSARLILGIRSLFRDLCSYLNRTYFELKHGT